MRAKFIVLMTVVLLLMLPALTSAQEMLAIESADVEVMSADQAYASYLAAPAEGGPYPGIVLIHSFNGLEEGYRTMTDQLAGEGFGCKQNLSVKK